MHVGKRYPIEQRVRVFMPFTSPSFWVAKAYEVHDVSWPIHTGAAAPATDFTDIVLQDIDPNSGTFVYYFNFNWSGKDVNFGWQGNLYDGNTKIGYTGYLTVDGVQQIAPIAIQPSNGDWEGIGYTVIAWSPVPGAILFPDFDFLEATGW